MSNTLSLPFSYPRMTQSMETPILKYSRSCWNILTARGLLSFNMWKQLVRFINEAFKYINKISRCKNPLEGTRNKEGPRHKSKGRKNSDSGRRRQRPEKHKPEFSRLNPDTTNNKQQTVNY